MEYELLTQDDRANILAASLRDLEANHFAATLHLRDVRTTAPALAQEAEAELQKIEQRIALLREERSEIREASSPDPSE